jgi:AraC-like DNA-binding protein
LAVLNLEQNRELPLTVNNIFFGSMFRNHCHTVESLRHQPESLAMLGLDDTIYRSIVALLAPALVFGDAARDADIRAKDFDALNLLCDYIQAHLSDPIALTELENISGLSARGLQYAFRRRFKCTPMQWIREERLNLAHDRLRHAGPGNTVASVALSCGFTNLGTFSNLYLQRFQQFPSVTLKNALR